MWAADRRGRMEKGGAGCAWKVAFRGRRIPRNKCRGVLAWEKGEIFPQVRGMFPCGDMFFCGGLYRGARGMAVRPASVRGTVGRGQYGRIERRRVPMRPRMEAFRKEGNGGAGGGQGKWPDTGTPYGGCRLTGAGENLPVKIPRRAGWRVKSNDNPQPLYCKGDGSRRPPCSICSFPKGRSDAIASVFVLSSAAAGAVRWKRRRPPA